MRRPAAGLLLALAAIAALAPAAAAGSGGGEVSPATRTLSNCVQRTGALLVDIQIDRSASLRSTDPEDRRVDGIGAALVQLERLAGESGADAPPPRVEALLSNFAGSVLPARPAAAWRRVDSGTIDRLLAQAERYGARDNGRDTDYALAFSAARQALDARAARVARETGTEPCKAILFLSDGRFHLGQRTGSTKLPKRVFYARRVNLEDPGAGARAVAIGHEFLCRPGGLMDRIVGDGIVTFTVALSASGEFKRADRAFLDALTTGGAGRARCGSRLSARTGEFTEVTDTSDLFFVFGTSVGADPGPCNPCPNPSQFEALPGLRGFVLSASTPLEGVELELTDPSGETAVLSGSGPERVELAGTTVDQHWIKSRSVDVEAHFDGGSDEWQGRWRFRFFAPESEATPVPVYELSLLSDLRPALVGHPDLVRGSRATLPIELRDGAGRPASAGALLALAQLHTVLHEGTGTSRPLQARRTGPGRFAVTIDVRDDSPDEWSLGTALTYPASPTPIQPEARSLSLPAPASPSQPPWWRQLAILAALLLLLGLVSLWLLFRHRREQAKFTPPQLLRGYVCDALVVAGEVELSPDPIELAYDDFEPLKREGRDARESRFRYPPFSFQAHASWRPGARARGEVTAGKRQLLGGRGAGPLVAEDERRRLRVPLEPAGTWLFALDSIDEKGIARGRLAILTDVDSSPDLGGKTLAAARAALAAQDWEGFAGSAAPSPADLDPADEPVRTVEIDDVDWDSL